MDRRQLENVVVRNMILKDKRFDSIEGQIPKEMYNRLLNRKSKVVEEDKQIRMNMVRKLCSVNNEEDIKEILKGIAPLLRHKKRSILLMGGNYEEVNKETQEAIVTFMSTMPKESAQLEKEIPIAEKSVQPEKESTMIHKSTQIEKASPVPKESKECVHI